MSTDNSNLPSSSGAAILSDPCPALPPPHASPRHHHRRFRDSVIGGDGCSTRHGPSSITVVSAPAREPSTACRPRGKPASRHTRFGFWRRINFVPHSTPPSRPSAAFSASIPPASCSCQTSRTPWPQSCAARHCHAVTRYSRHRTPIQRCCGQSRRTAATSAHAHASLRCHARCPGPTTSSRPSSMPSPVARDLPSSIRSPHLQHCDCHLIDWSRRFAAAASKSSSTPPMPAACSPNPALKGQHGGRRICTSGAWRPLAAPCCGRVDRTAGELGLWHRVTHTSRAIKRPLPGKAPAISHRGSPHHKPLLGYTSMAAGQPFVDTMPPWLDGRAIDWSKHGARPSLAPDPCAKG